MDVKIFAYIVFEKLDLAIHIFILITLRECFESFTFSSLSVIPLVIIELKNNILGTGLLLPLGERTKKMVVKPTVKAI